MHLARTGSTGLAPSKKRIPGFVQISRLIFYSLYYGRNKWMAMCVMNH